MIENYRSGLLWDRFMANPEIAPMLTALGFVADSGAVTGVTPDRAARAAAGGVAQPVGRARCRSRSSCPSRARPSWTCSTSPAAA